MGDTFKRQMGRRNLKRWKHRQRATREDGTVFTKPPIIARVAKRRKR